MLLCLNLLLTLLSGSSLPLKLSLSMKLSKRSFIFIFIHVYGIWWWLRLWRWNMMLNVPKYLHLYVCNVSVKYNIDHYPQKKIVFIFTWFLLSKVVQGRHGGLSAVLRSRVYFVYLFSSHMEGKKELMMWDLSEVDTYWEMLGLQSISWRCTLQYW